MIIMFDSCIWDLHKSSPFKSIHKVGDDAGDVGDATGDAGDATGDNRDAASESERLFHLILFISNDVRSCKFSSNWHLWRFEQSKTIMQISHR